MTDAEKILRFAGYRVNEFSWPEPHRAPDGLWLAALPDTTDLTWLFKWCVPKLNELLSERGWTISVTPWNDPIFEVWLGARLDVFGEGNDLGEALRAAIVALIESGKAVPA